MVRRSDSVELLLSIFICILSTMFKAILRVALSCEAANTVPECKCNRVAICIPILDWKDMSRDCGYAGLDLLLHHQSKALLNLYEHGLFFCFEVVHRNDGT